MKQIITAIAVLFITVVNAQTEWQKIELTPTLSISFPAKPVASSPTNGVKSLILKPADSTATYIVAVNDLQITAGIDAATLGAEMEKDESWEQAKTAFVSSMGGGATLIKDEMVTVQKNKAMKLIVEQKNTQGQTNTLTVLIFVQGSNSINVIFNSRAGKGDEKMKEQFFNSIEVK